MALTRRQLFGLSGGVVSGVGLAACGVALTAPGGSTGAVLASRVPLPEPFEVDLPQPDILLHLGNLLGMLTTITAAGFALGLQITLGLLQASLQLR